MRVRGENTLRWFAHNCPNSVKSWQSHDYDFIPLINSTYCWLGLSSSSSSSWMRLWTRCRIVETSWPLDRKTWPTDKQASAPWTSSRKLLTVQLLAAAMMTWLSHLIKTRWNQFENTSSSRTGWLFLIQKWEFVRVLLSWQGTRDADSAEMLCLCSML